MIHLQPAEQEDAFTVSYHSHGTGDAHEQRVPEMLAKVVSESEDGTTLTLQLQVGNESPMQRPHYREYCLSLLNGLSGPYAEAIRALRSSRWSKVQKVVFTAEGN